VRIRKTAAIVIALGVSLFAACGGNDKNASGTTGGGGATSASDGGGGAQPTTSTGGSGGSGGSGGTCQRTFAPVDATRVVVVSHPFSNASKPSPKYEVLELSSDGKLTQTHQTFSLGPSTEGRMAFTPDGQVGIVAETDGSLGVVRFDEQRKPTVVDPSFHGKFYATQVFIEPGGASALVLDFDTRENGGGVYRVGIACDGTLSDEGLVAAAKLPGGFAWLSDGMRGVLAADDALGSMAQGGAELLKFSPGATLLGSANAFGDDQAILSALAVTHDEKFALIADDDQSGDPPPRLAVVGIGASALTPVQVLSGADTMITDPADLATSPFDNAAIVVSAFDNAIFAFDYDPSNMATPFTLRGELTYVGEKPQLPVVAAPITRGKLNGMVLVAENSGVRQVRFETNGDVTDLGLLSLGSDVASATGSLGVSP
jgi:hypothetical protein